MTSSHIWWIGNQSMILLREGKNKLGDSHIVGIVVQFMSLMLLFPTLDAEGKVFAVLLRDVKLHDAAQVTGLVAELHSFKKRTAVFAHIVHEHTEEVVERILRLRHIEHTWLAMSISKGIVLLASLQQEGESGELLGTGVEVNTCEVMTEDVFDGFATAIAFGNV